MRYVLTLVLLSFGLLAIAVACGNGEDSPRLPTRRW